jgi:glycosyltransferase involved in cell wall biosynthesis
VRGLFVEPYYRGSHRTFLDGLVDHVDHEVVPLTLPGGGWRRRMRRGAQELAAMSGEVPGEFDYLVATDMLDLPTFLALTRPRFSGTPIMLYMHENQFTYPRIRGTKLNSWFGQINYLSACAADVVAFNSAYHCAEFLGALRTLAGQPNNWLVAESIEEIAAKSTVLPIGIDLASLDAYRSSRQSTIDNRRLVLWNHRWEFDKSPEMFARVIRKVAEAGVEFELAIAGDPGDNPSPALSDLRDTLGGRVVHCGYLRSRAAYARLLWKADVVVSTSGTSSSASLQWRHSTAAASGRARPAQLSRARACGATTSPSGGTRCTALSYYVGRSKRPMPRVTPPRERGAVRLVASGAPVGQGAQAARGKGTLTLRLR